MERSNYSLISDYWQEIIKGCLIKDDKKRFSSQDLRNKLQEKTEFNDNNIEQNVDNVKEEKDIDLLMKQADSFRECKQYQEAINLYTKAIELNPDYTNAYKNRGNAYRNLKEYEKAIADYTKAIKLDPNNPSIYYNRGAIYGDLKEYIQAIIYYTKAIELNPDFTLAENNLKFAQRKL